MLKGDTSAPPGRAPGTTLESIVLNPDNAAPVESSETSANKVSRVEIPGYRILQVRGVGAMATVYLAEHQALGRKVALKVLHAVVAQDEDYRERFLREARAAARLNHESVVRAYEAGVHEGSYWLAMEYVEGEDLSERLDREGSLTEHEALRIAVAVCKALEVASKHGMVHRDVKPENILLGADGEVKLADLGLAKVYDDGSGTVTAEGISVGTVAFFSPEQCRGRRDLDVRSDLFALGGTLYTMISGELPFDRGDNPPVTMKRIIDEWPSELDDATKFSPSVRAAIKALMAKRRRDRPADARDAAALLREAAEHLDESQFGVVSDAGPAEPAATKRRGRRRRRNSRAPAMPPGVLLAAVGTLAFVVFALVVVRRADAPRPPEVASRSPTVPVVEPGDPRPTPATSATPAESPAPSPDPTVAEASPPPATPDDVPLVDAGTLRYDWRSARQLDDWAVSGNGSEARVHEGVLHFRAPYRGRLELIERLEAPLEIECDLQLDRAEQAWLTLEWARGEGLATAGGALFALHADQTSGLIGEPRRPGAGRLRLVLTRGEARGWFDGVERFRHAVALDGRRLTLGLLAEGGATLSVGPLTIKAGSE